MQAVEAELVVEELAVEAVGAVGGGSVGFTVTVQASSDSVTKNVGTVQVTVP
jgi:hypothetical protein